MQTILSAADTSETYCGASHFEKSEPRLTLEFTRDKILIAEYRQLRKELYKNDPRFVGFRFFCDDEAEFYEDPDDQMIVIHDGKHCYGGACLRVSTPKKPIILDMEKDILPPDGNWYFSLREMLAEMELDKYAYAEFNRIFLHPDLRSGAWTIRIFEAVRDRCLDYRVRYIFGSSDLMRARYYRQLFTKAGLDGGTLPHIDIPMRPEYEGKRMHLFYGDTRKFFTVPGDPEATRLLEPISEFSLD